MKCPWQANRRRIRLIFSSGRNTLSGTGWRTVRVGHSADHRRFIELFQGGGHQHTFAGRWSLLRFGSSKPAAMNGPYRDEPESVFFLTNSGEKKIDSAKSFRLE